jgi:hypothetical protein
MVWHLDLEFLHVSRLPAIKWKSTPDYCQTNPSLNHKKALLARQGFKRNQT